MKIYAIIVTYNRKELLMECLECLLLQTYKPLEIIIVDNSSNTETQESVQNNPRYRNIYYFKTSSNMGGAGGFSFGIKKAFEYHADYCWLMDDDTMPCPSALESLVKKHMTIKASFICSRIQWIDHSACNMNIPSMFNSFLLNQKALDNHLIEINSCSFVSTLIKMDCVKKIGLPISDFFIYGDDVDFSRRLSTVEKGYLDLDSIAIHKMRSNQSNLITCPSDRIDRYFYSCRNRVYICRVHHHSLFFKNMDYYIRLFLLIIFSSKDKKIKRIFVLTTGTIRGFFFFPQIEYLDKKTT